MTYCDTCQTDTNHGGYDPCPVETKARLDAALLQNREKDEWIQAFETRIQTCQKMIEDRDRLVEGARKILSGGYHQGSNGLVINLNQAEAWLKGDVAERPNHDGLKLGESRGLPFPKPISNDDAIKRNDEVPCSICAMPLKKWLNRTTCLECERA